MFRNAIKTMQSLVTSFILCSWVLKVLLAGRLKILVFCLFSKMVLKSSLSYCIIIVEKKEFLKNWCFTFNLQIFLTFLVLQTLKMYAINGTNIWMVNFWKVYKYNFDIIIFWIFNAYLWIVSVTTNSIFLLRYPLLHQQSVVQQFTELLVKD